ncbi:PepSY domain-containing protein [Bosea sp. AS-1]|uniref:PepSY domain-containing protein n=1 Tax=Bosea sp. AS-1 TaxID=2015316 RepID=UPI0012FD2D46|nr:PepSY domain-containing protein [Bosea sp. AS-1]
MRMNGAARLLALTLFGGFAALPSPAIWAQAAATSPEDGQTISESRAREIAWSAGLVHVEEITRAGDRWELAGRTVDDDEIILDIDARDGRILD